MEQKGGGRMRRNSKLETVQTNGFPRANTGSIARGVRTQAAKVPKMRKNVSRQLKGKEKGPEGTVKGRKGRNFTTLRPRA